MVLANYRKMMVFKSRLSERLSSSVSDFVTFMLFSVFLDVFPLSAPQCKTEQAFMPPVEPIN